MTAGTKPLGFWTATSLVTGNMIGSGVFLLPASLAAFGGISVFGWLFSAAGSVLLALVFAKLARQVPGSGGPYRYSREGFGELPGFLVAWGYWIALLATNAAIAIALVSYLSVFWPALATQRWLGTAMTLVFVWLLVVINARGVRQAGRVQLASTVLKVLPLVAVGGAGLLFLEPAHFDPWNRSGEPAFSAVTATAALTLWAFLGMESANIPAAEVSEPEKNVPRAAVVGTLIAALVYIPGTVAVMRLIAPDELALSNAPFADAAAQLWGKWGFYLVGAGAIVSCFGALNGWTLCLGQIPMAAAKDGLFPQFFTEMSDARTPAKGIIVSSLFVSMLVLMNGTEGLVDQFNHVILLATLATLLPYLLCSLGRLAIAIRTRQPLSIPDVLVCLLAAAFSIWAIMGTGMETVYWGGFLLMLGVPVHVWVKWRVSRDR